MSRHKTFVILFILIGITLPIVFVFAQQLELEGQYPQLPGVESPTVGMGPAGYLKYIFVLGLAVSGLAAAAMIVAGGVMYMLAAGNESKMGEAKDRIFSAIGGLVLIIAAYLIIKTINPDLLTFREPKVNLPKAGWQAGAGPSGTSYEWACLRTNQDCRDVKTAGSVEFDPSNCAASSKPSCGSGSSSVCCGLPPYYPTTSDSATCEKLCSPRPFDVSSGICKCQEPPPIVLPESTSCAGKVCAFDSTCSQGECAPLLGEKPRYNQSCSISGSGGCLDSRLTCRNLNPPFREYKCVLPGKTGEKCQTNSECASNQCNTSFFGSGTRWTCK